MSDNKNILVVISGGGTGGHVFPAIAIAQAIEKLMPNANIKFVGAYGRLEMDKVPKAGYEIDGLWIDGFIRKKIVPNLLLPFKLTSSLLKSFYLVLKNKPNIGIGVGGYASGPYLKMASWLGVPIILQEANAFPGITNKLLASGASKICVAYNNLDRFFPKDKIIFTGNPVRETFFKINDIEKSEAYKHFGLKPNKPVLFVTGGSGGAKPMNIAIEADLAKYINLGVQIIWQCGKAYLEQYKKYANPENGILVFDFIDKIDNAYAIADLVVSRAGALSIAEQQAMGKAVILVPSPYVTEDHQTKNAEALVKENAALMLKDVELENKLFETVKNTIFNEEKKENFAKNMKAMAVNNAAEEIAKEALKLIKIK